MQGEINVQMAKIFPPVKTKAVFANINIIAQEIIFENQMMVCRPPNRRWSIFVSNTISISPRDGSSGPPKRTRVPAIDDIIRNWKRVVRMTVIFKVDFADAFPHGTDERGKVTKSILIAFAAFDAVHW